MAALVACPASGAVAALSRPLTATCDFERPELNTDAEGVTRVTLSGCAQRVRPGEPVVPFRTLRLLLPQGSTATGVVARATSPTVTLPGAWQLELGREPAASAAPRPGKPVASVPIPSPYPGVLAELVSVQRMAGYDIAILRVFPLQYFPAPRRLEFTAAVAVEVLLSPMPRQTLRARADVISPSPSLVEQRRVSSAIDNPAAVSEVGALLPSAIGDPSGNYLLVTRAALLPAFQPLIEQKQAAGMTVFVGTMESITNLYAGVDAAERLRNYIREAYTTQGLKYVLLGGDSKVVPYRGVYARCAGVIWTLMPSDLYFACLDGSWNRDGDGIWGEPTDGETGGDVDLLAEVCIGRAPVESAAEVANFVARCLSAEQAPSSQFGACLAGEFLNSAGAQGGDALDTLLPALDGSFCPVSRLDDRPLASAVWSASDALAALNRSPLLAAHFGHGVEYGYDTTVLRLTAADLGGLTNAHPFLLYSTACNSGAFDNNFGMADCIAEELVKYRTHGAFAVLANSREGWYDSTTEERYSGEFQKRFFDRVLADRQVPIGVAHQLARQDLLGSVETSGSNMPYRWCAFGITLFGDPHAVVRVPLAVRFQFDSDARALTWNSWPGYRYRVLRSTELAAGFGFGMASNIVATPPLNTWTDAAPGLVRAFYRVEAEAP